MAAVKRYKYRLFLKILLLIEMQVYPFEEGISYDTAISLGWMVFSAKITTTRMILATNGEQLNNENIQIVNLLNGVSLASIKRCDSVVHFYNVGEVFIGLCLLWILLFLV